MLLINALRRSEQAGSYMRECLHRMNQYLPVIQKALNITAMPIELLAIPLIESGYQPLVENKNPTLASGIWQLMPKTARHFGLIVKAKHDDRLNTLLETNAAVTYLNAMYDQFNDWKLVVIAYKIGEDKTEELIKAVGSRDASVLIHSSKAPRHLKKYISMFDSTVIIIRNPSLIAE
jgi:membrane-bound lytic murein transglycosylase D